MIVARNLTKVLVGHKTKISRSIIASVMLG